MNHHLVQGASSIDTEQLDDTARLIKSTASRLAMSAITGPAGLGKTFATDYAVEQLTDLTSHYTVFERRASEKDLVCELLKLTTGVEQEGTYRQLRNQLIRFLSEEPHLIVVDEAQELRLQCVETLRFLWDRPETRLSIVFVGGPACWGHVGRSGVTGS